MAIKMPVERISHLVRLVNNQIMDAMPMPGMIHPPGTMNVFSEISCFSFRNMMVEIITAR